MRRSPAPYAVRAAKAILGKLLLTARKVAEAEGLEDGYRLVINDGPQGCARPAPAELRGPNVCR